MPVAFLGQQRNETTWRGRVRWLSRARADLLRSLAPRFSCRSRPLPAGMLFTKSLALGGSSEAGLAEGSNVGPVTSPEFQLQLPPSPGKQVEPLRLGDWSVVFPLFCLPSCVPGSHGSQTSFVSCLCHLFLKRPLSGWEIRRGWCIHGGHWVLGAQKAAAPLAELSAGVGLQGQSGRQRSVSD